MKKQYVITTIMLTLALSIVLVSAVSMQLFPSRVYKTVESNTQYCNAIHFKADNYEYVEVSEVWSDDPNARWFNDFDKSSEDLGITNNYQTIQELDKQGKYGKYGLTAIDFCYTFPEGKYKGALVIKPIGQDGNQHVQAGVWLKFNAE